MKPSPLPARAAALAASLLAFALVAGPSRAQEREPAQDVEDLGYYQSYVFGTPDTPSREWILAYGGRLYDQWWAVLLQDPPDGSHPGYPASGARRGEDSWRCVTCHGWDYRGTAEGGPRSSIEGAIGKTPEDIVATLRGDQHGFSSEQIPDKAAMSLALFVSLGQTAEGEAYDPETGRFRGDPERGRAVFQNVCAICHDYDGGAWIEGEEGIGDTLGKIARGAPGRALHKVMNGQTYADMPAMRAFGLATVVDILSYVQTLEDR